MKYVSASFSRTGIVLKWRIRLWKLYRIEYQILTQIMVVIICNHLFKCSDTIWCTHVGQLSFVETRPAGNLVMLFVPSQSVDLKVIFEIYSFSSKLVLVQEKKVRFELWPAPVSYLQLVKVDLRVLWIRLSRIGVLAVLPLPLAPQTLDNVLVHVANVNMPRLQLR